MSRVVDWRLMAGSADLRSVLLRNHLEYLAVVDEESEGRLSRAPLMEH